MKVFGQIQLIFYFLTKIIQSMKGNWISFSCLIGLLSLLWSCGQPIMVPPIGNPADLQNFLSDSLGVDSCVVRDTLAPSDLPGSAQAYLITTFPQDTATSFILYQSATDSLYQVELNTGRIILFDASGNYLWDGDPSILDPASLDDDLVDTLNHYFPGLQVEDVELEWSHQGMSAYEIYLESGIELYVLTSGNAICFVVQEDDDDDPYHGSGCDDDYFSVDSLSPTILQYIDSVYPNAIVEGCAEVETYCDSVDTYHIEIEKMSGEDVYLVFDFNDVFLHELSESVLASLPIAVQNSISSNYPGFSLENDILVLTQSNGDEYFQVWMENGNTDEELSVIFDANGGVVCEMTDP